MVNFALVITLERHIEILLLDNDCVIVPGLGGFMAHHVDARYVGEDNLFLPPLRTLGFNPQLKLNDSLLVQSYIEAFDISYPEAQQRLEADVEVVRQKLCNEGIYEFSGIGTLRMSGEDTFLFEPYEAGVLTPSLYGLGSFEMLPLCSTLSVKGQHVDDATAATSILIADDAADSVSDDNDDRNVIKIKIAWLRNAVAVAAAIVALFFITPPVSNGDAGRLNLSGMNGMQFFDAVATRYNEPQDTARHPSINLLSQEVEEKTSADADVAGAPAAELVREEVASERDDAFCIVMASKITPRNADFYAKKIRSKGFEQTAVYKSNGIVRVIYGSYATEAEACSDLRKLRRQDDFFKQAWIYQKR